MKFFIVGSGGREHTLVWALRRSPLVKKIYSATTNAGIRSQTIQANLSGSGIESIVDFAVGEKIDLVVIGPEQPLVEGLADALVRRGIPVFGPVQKAAMLEGSKAFSKEFMARHRIPAARSRTAETAEEAFSLIDDGEFGFPVVIKADGLAAGKGVVIASDAAEARKAIADFMVERTLGVAGNRLVVEECLQGRELSYLVLSDGHSYTAMPVAQDHKRAFDDDKGPNTGGMGTFSTPGLIDHELERTIRNLIVEPSLNAALSDGFPFKGVLYCGLMLTAEGPKVLEYNVRFGDPETQVILRRLDSDFAEIALAVAHGRLDQVRPTWSGDSATCVVLASEGYPGSYPSGRVITGIEDAETIDGALVFHAGTKLDDSGRVVTSGGRVLGVTARAATLELASELAYKAAGRIHFDGMHFRKDIGRMKASI